ncbi:CDP-alcohol phosphatidyltransferase family protein [Candidatus Gracilibacteria bacterium]|nr:CDP-alcohol phosphatidyltransferase family protein [Candidatus Gracilibacteria bacterium]NJM88523.1 CDP-alcohol phosphatidyltransferase family protein [Hydrococcus sp. RU_2_2]NJP21255.1 CDP-alcohol phosphatidyltransferase family protein [Hydrococcus sp. CRU_1_1]NJQ98386.1 CDP-alcohol phosphatidyltransferase family protein [Hydrococcus sp. CSU_1_8]
MSEISLQNSSPTNPTDDSDLEEHSSIVVPKSFLDRAIHSITEKLASILVNITWITPNQISWLSGGLGGLVAGWFIVRENYLLAVFFIILSGILDCLDGDLARARNMASGEGDILDSVIDRYVDFLLIAALILVFPNNYLIPGLLALLGTTLVPYVRARSEAEGKSTVASIGSRSTRTILIIIGLLTQQILPLLILLAAITNIASIHRLIFALKK